VSLPKRVVFLEIKTTGFSPEENEIIEIGAVKNFTDCDQPEFHRLVRPSSGHLPPAVLEKYPGITAEKLQQAPALEEIKGELEDYLEHLPVLCHRAVTLRKFLEKALNFKNPLLDSRELFCLFKPHFPHHHLDYLVRNYLEKEEGSWYCKGALEEARHTRTAVDKLMQELPGEEAELLNKALELMGNTAWPWKDVLQKLPLGMITTWASHKKAPQTPVKSPYGMEQLTEIMQNPELWQEYFPGYVPKEQQIELTGEVARAFSEGAALFAEAPTGSGKTLAYLLVALLWALENDEKVYLSTNTKNLQEQVKEELPRLLGVLEARGFPVADLKGMANYVCLRQVEEELKTPGKEKEDRLARLFLYNWSRRIESGEVEDVSYWFLENYPLTETLFNRVRCRREECLREDCPRNRQCFYQQRVTRMQRSKVTVINHSLLLTWPPSFPEIKKLVIDEAHQLEDKAFDSFTEEVYSEELKGVLYRLSHGKDKGYLNYLLFQYQKINPGENFSPAFEAVERLREKADAVTARIKTLSGASGDEDRAFAAEIKEEWEELRDEVNDCAVELEELGTFIKKTLEEMEQKDDTVRETPLSYSGNTYLNTCLTWARVLKQVFNPRLENVCRYVRYQKGKWRLGLAPLEVAEPFYQKVLQDIEAIVLTSATLSEGGCYGRLQKSLGFELMEDMELRGAEPGSPVFNYRENCVLALPADSPGHRSPQLVSFLARGIVDISKLLGGRTMVLFTNLDRMKAVYDRIRKELEKEGIDVLASHRHSRNFMAEHLRENSNTVLLGSRGFFEGVDIRGPALSCIVTDKLPFPYPGDPLYQARNRHLTSQGRDPYREMGFSTMLRTFRQQFGRLIRSESDRGFVVVMSQLNSSHIYYNPVINELPPVEVIEKTMPEIIREMETRFTGWHQW